MFKQIISLFLFQNINCFFTEIKGLLKPRGWDTTFKWEIEPEKFYWFELANRIYLAYFNNSSKYHSNPYLLFIVIPEARREDCYIPEFCCLLKSAFDRFYLTSAFLSLLPNKKNAVHYQVLVRIEDMKIEGEIQLGDKTTFTGKNFKLKGFNLCISLLNSVEIGTKRWHRFYKVKDYFYGLFVETYYVIYRNDSGESETAVLLKTADLVEMSLIKFQTNSVQGEVFLTENENIFEINPKKDTFHHTYNFHVIKMDWSESNYIICFDLEQSGDLEFQSIFEKNKPKEEEVEMPLTKRLSQVGQENYLVKDTKSEKVVVETPSYFIGKKLEVSKLVVPFRVIVSKPNGLSEAQVVFRMYDFNHKQNHFWFFTTKKHLVCFDYFVKNGKLFFIITDKPKELGYVSITDPVKVVETFKETEMKGVLEFLNGTVIFDRNSAITLTGYDPGVEERETNSASEKRFKSVCRRHRNKIVFLLTGLVLATVCFFIKRTNPRFKKKIKQKHK